MKVTKKVSLDLVGVDGNAFSIMGTFMRQAREENWSKEEIDFVINKAKSSDYDNLLSVIVSYCK